MSKKSTLRILTINPGSTSTKIGVFHNEKIIFEHSVRHSARKLEAFQNIWDQYMFRKEEIMRALHKEGIDISSLDGIVGRGGLLRPVPSGVYAIDEQMIEDARIGFQGQHASNLGCVIAYGIGWEHDIPSFIVDPPSVDELEPLARISGHAAIERNCLLHALNIFATARVYGDKHNVDFREKNIIVAHLGGGITVAALRKGQAINVNNGLDEGPFTPERSGRLPLLAWMKICRSGEYDEGQLKKMVAGKGGLTSYCQTNNAADVEAMVKSGSERFAVVFEAMAYQIAEEIGSRATNLRGEVDAVVLTGGLAHSRMLTDWISERVSFIGPVVIYPGENELKALALGGLRVLRGEETARSYSTKYHRVGICCWTSLSLYSRAIQVIEDTFRGAGCRFRTGNADTMEFTHHNCQGSEDRVRELADYYRENRMDLIFAVGSPVSARLAHYLRDTNIPIVFTGVHSPPVLGKVNWAKQPTFHAVCYSSGLMEQLDATLKPLTPKVTRLGMIYRLGELQSEIQLDELRMYCQKHRIQLSVIDVQTVEEAEGALTRLSKDKVEWLILGATTVAARLGKDFFVECARHFPVLCPFEENIREGGFIGLLSSWDEACAEAAKIGLQRLEGSEPPEQLVRPQEQRLLVNREAAEKLKLLKKVEKLPGVELI